MNRQEEADKIMELEKVFAKDDPYVASVLCFLAGGILEDRQEELARLLVSWYEGRRISNNRLYSDWLQNG